MSDMDFFELQALERATLTRRDFEPRENTIPPKKTARIKEKVTSLPVEFPENRNYPSFQTVFSEENEKQKTQQGKKQNKNAVKNDMSNNLSDVLHDPEAALLGGLIMLLRSEGADEALLAALGYILM